MWDVDDTIAAIASAPGGALRGIVRLSGPRVVDCILPCFGSPRDVNLAELRHSEVVTGTLRLPSPLHDVPCDVLLWPTGRSYTRQPSAELHTIGSPPILDAALRAVCSAGARLAQPGEFTLRAFLAGRLDLTQAEAVLGVIDAKGQQQLAVALEQLAGGLAAPLNGLRDRLLDLLAHLEAGLDFVEEDIEFVTADELEHALGQAGDEIERIAARMTARGETAPEARVVLIGWPNVGKSSLFNALIGGEGAIVSDVAGTTRDYVCVRHTIAEVACLLIDTAGVQPFGPIADIAAEAQTMTSEQQQQAALQLFCLDATRRLNPWERAALAADDSSHRIVVVTKIDAGESTDFTGPAIRTSSQTHAGLDELRHEIRRRVLEQEGGVSSVVGSTAVRCGESLRLAHAGLERARQLVTSGFGDELVAAELRGALDELGKVVGVVYTDDILDRVFSRFCIGK